MSEQNTALFGSVDATATFLDGTTKTVRVRQLPVRQMHNYLQAQDSEPAMIELVCNLDAAAVDALAPESHVELISLCDKVNADFFASWLERLKTRTEKLMPGAIEKVSATLAAMPGKSA